MRRAGGIPPARTVHTKLSLEAADATSLRLPPFVPRGPGHTMTRPLVASCVTTAQSEPSSPPPIKPTASPLCAYRYQTNFCLRKMIQRHIEVWTPPSPLFEGRRLSAERQVQRPGVRRPSPETDGARPIRVSCLMQVKSSWPLPNR